MAIETKTTYMGKECELIHSEKNSKLEYYIQPETPGDVDIPLLLIVNKNTKEVIAEIQCNMIPTNYNDEFHSYEIKSFVYNENI